MHNSYLIRMNYGSGRLIFSANVLQLEHRSKRRLQLKFDKFDKFDAEQRDSALRCESSECVRTLASWTLACFFILAALSCAHLIVVPDAHAAEAGTPVYSAKPANRTVEDTAKQVYRLLVEVEGAIKGGTGFLASGRRVVATNHHVIESGTAYSVGFIDKDGSVKRIPLRLLAIFPRRILRFWKRSTICQAQLCRYRRFIPTLHRSFMQSVSPLQPIRKAFSHGHRVTIRHFSSPRSSKAMCRAF